MRYLSISYYCKECIREHVSLCIWMRIYVWGIFLCIIRISYLCCHMKLSPNLSGLIQKKFMPCSLKTSCRFRGFSRAVLLPVFCSAFPRLPWSYFLHISTCFQDHLGKANRSSRVLHWRLYIQQEVTSSFLSPNHWPELASPKDKGIKE